jgi:hypothetical protein
MAQDITSGFKTNLQGMIKGKEKSLKTQSKYQKPNQM